MNWLRDLVKGVIEHIFTQLACLAIPILWILANAILFYIINGCSLDPSY